LLKTIVSLKDDLVNRTLRRKRIPQRL